MKILLILFLFVSLVQAQTIVDKKSNTELQKVSLQLHWKYEFEFAGFIAAKEKGFYRDAGLDVTLKEFQNGIDIIDDVVSGKSTYGVYNSNTLLEYLEGKPIVLLASFFKRSALVLITQKDIKTPKDLIGKKIMSSSAKDMKLNFKAYLDGYGVKLNDLHLVPNSFNVQDFADKKVDAMTAFISDQPYKLNQLGVKYNILDPSNDNLFSLQEELFTSKKEAKYHPKRTVAFRNASIKGWQYALSHKDEMINIIHTKYAPEISKNALKYEAKAIDKLILPFIYDIGSIDMNFLKKQIRLFKNDYQVGESKSLNDFVFKEKNKNVKLSQQEIKYIDKHPVVNVCLHKNQFPIEDISHGKFIGMMSEIYNTISQKVYIKFKPVMTNSDEELQKFLDTNKCDIVSVCATNDKRFKTIKPTKSFTKVHFTLLSKHDKSFVTDVKYLKNKVLVTRIPAYRDYLLRLYPYLNIEVELNEKNMVQKVLSNRAYAIIAIDIRADYIIDKYGYGKLKINGFLAKDKPLSVSIGIEKNEPILFSIIQKALDTINTNKFKMIEDSWRISRYQKNPDYTALWYAVSIMGLIFLLMAYYQRKLKIFNNELENMVAIKTKELREMNNSLEATVNEKVNELIQKDEILTRQSKQAVMGEMISMIAHQWRQPLNTITLQISNMQLKDMVGQEVTKEELMKTFDDINQTVIYLSDTIDDFKTYFHPDRVATTIVLNEIIQKVIKFIAPRLKKNNILIKVECEDEMELTTYFNELLQVLLNIINNAIDAYETSSVPIKNITVNCQTDKKKLKIFIRDNAGGISETILHEIFEPYMSTKGKNGTGLGLYMSKMIIEKQFSGNLNVESSRGTTTFVIEIPCDITKK
jgi:signal transduction histidine kinase/ABC-type nitrate/sulfonate/bicarbonate transport system substrate-binding protein